VSRLAAGPPERGPQKEPPRPGATGRAGDQVRSCRTDPSLDGDQPPSPSIRIEVSGPVAPYRTRARILPGTNRVWSSRDRATVNYQAAIRTLAQHAMAGRPPFSGAVELAIEIHVAAPKSMAKYRRVRALAGLLRPTTRPDTTNVLKAAEDALTGIVFRDDAQVAVTHAVKVYAENPRLVIEVREISTEA
jgi:Holliday junction resolvase RusA-like endonuclease